MARKNSDEFYALYLPMPKTYKSFLLSVVASTFLIVGLVGVLIASSQRDPGSGTGWDPDGLGAIEIEGVVSEKPYDLLRFRTLGTTQPIQTALITSMVKSSVSDRLKGKYGKALKLRGVMIRREGRKVFALLDNDDALQEAQFSTTEFIPPIERGIFETKLRGEVIDPKCYLGAMKPGGGKTHKNCAVLCLRGGIPPMFVVRDEKLHEVYYLATNLQGEALGEDVIPFVGDPIEVTGVVTQRGDLLVFKMDMDSIQRL